MMERSGREGVRGEDAEVVGRGGRVREGREWSGGRSGRV